MKAVTLFCTIILCSIASFAQIIYRNGDIALIPGGYPIESPLNQVSDIGFHNPSNLSRFNGLSMGFSYQYGSTLNKPYFADFKGKSILNGIPYSAALSFQSGDLHLALATAQRYNLSLEAPPVLLSTMEGTRGSAGTVDVSFRRNVQEYSLMASYMINNLPENNSLSFGFRFSLGVLNFSDQISYKDVNSPFYLNQGVDVQTPVYSSSIALGADYTIASAAGNLNLGVYFEKGLEFKKEVQKELTSGPYTDSNGLKYYHLYNLYIIHASTPDALRLDAVYEFSKFRIMANVSEIFWKEISEDYKNNIEASAGAIYKTSDMLSVFFGASINDRKYSDNYDGIFAKDYNALFLTLGADAAYGSYTFGLSLSDSHLFSAETRKQTIARLTLGYKL